MASRSGVAHVPSSPSYLDSEAASQQLLAEASSPGLRSPAATAIRGADLLNYARTLTKSSPPAPTRPPASAVKLRPKKLQKPGKLARVSLASLASEEASQKKPRGAHMYDLEPSPDKRRPHSLPAQLANSEDDVEAGTVPFAIDFDELPFATNFDEQVPETSQAQPLDARAALTEAVRNAEPPPREIASASKKPRGRPRKSGASTTSVALSETSYVEVEETPEKEADSRVAVDIVPSSPPLLPQEEAASAAEESMYRSHESGENTASSQVVEAGNAPSEEHEPKVSDVDTRAKRTRHPGKKLNTSTSDERTSNGPSKKLRKLHGPMMVSPDMPDFEEDMPLPIATRQEPRQPQNEEPIRSSRSRTARAEAEIAAAHSNSAIAIITAAYDPAAPSASQRARKRTSAESARRLRPLKRQKSKETRASEKEASLNDRAQGEASEDVGELPTGSVQLQDGHGVDVGDNAPIEDYSEERDGQQHDKQQHDEEISSQNDRGANAHGDQAHNEQKEHQDVNADANTDADADVPQAADAEVTDATPSRLSSLDQVFHFIDSGKRPGKCMTKLGRAVHRDCTQMRATLSRSGDDETSLEDIAKCESDLTNLLKSINNKVQEERRAVFKRDAFAYLFLELTLVLKATWDKLKDAEEDIAGSLGAMQIVYHFVREILVFKDTMDSWKVKVPQLTQGDRLIKDVESNLIVHLRAVEKEFRIPLRQLQRMEQRRQAMLEVQQLRVVREQDLAKEEEERSSERDRRQRWQDLHIARMQCEPDPARRRRLRFVEPTQVRETDANGRPFERVPFFGERSAPPPQWAASSSDREWTTEQETVLLDDMRSSVDLARIFRRHCGPHGPLRDFSVSDFAAKMSWIRSGWAQLSQQHGWEIPDWVMELPALP